MNGWPAVAIIVVAQIARRSVPYPRRGAAMVALPRDIGFDDRLGPSHGPAYHGRRLEISTGRDLVRWPCIWRANFPAAYTPVIFVSRSVVGLVRGPHGVRGQPAALTLW